MLREVSYPRSGSATRRERSAAGQRLPGRRRAEDRWVLFAAPGVLAIAILLLPLGSFGGPFASGVAGSVLSPRGPSNDSGPLTAVAIPGQLDRGLPGASTPSTFWSVDAQTACSRCIA